MNDPSWVLGEELTAYVLSLGGVLTVGNFEVMIG